MPSLLGGGFCFRLEEGHIGRHEIVVKTELVIESVYILIDQRLEIDEQDCKASVPEIDLFGVLRLSRLFNLFVQRVESDDVAEQILQPCCKNVTKGIKLALLLDEPAEGLKTRLETGARRGSQRETDPLCCVENVVLCRRLQGDFLVLPLHVSSVIDQDRLLEVLGASRGAGQRLLGFKSLQEGIPVVEVHLSIGVVLS